MSIEAVFKFVAVTVPSIMVLGGILLLVLGYPIGNDAMIRGGWALIFSGGGIYVLEIFLYYNSSH